MQLQFPGMPDQLTRSEGRILDYISSNSDEFFLSSIGEVSERLDVSVTTLSRFARHLGFQNYKEFKQSVIQQTSSSGPAAKLAGTLGGEGFSVRGWFLRQQEHLLKTLEGLDEEGFSLAAEAALAEAPGAAVREMPVPEEKTAGQESRGAEAQGLAPYAAPVPESDAAGGENALTAAASAPLEEAGALEALLAHLGLTEADGDGFVPLGLSGDGTAWRFQRTEDGTVYAVPLDGGEITQEPQTEQAE